MYIATWLRIRLQSIYSVWSSTSLKLDCIYQEVYNISESLCSHIWRRQVSSLVRTVVLYIRGCLVKYSSRGLTLTVLRLLVEVYACASLLILDCYQLCWSLSGSKLAHGLHFDFMIEWTDSLILSASDLGCFLCFKYLWEIIWLYWKLMVAFYIILIWF